MNKSLTILCLTGSSLAAVPGAFAPSALAATHISQSWRLHKIAANGPVVVDAGTVRGAPLGSGSIRITTTARADGTIAFSFRERLAHGSITGSGRLTYAFSPSHDKVLYRGTGAVTGGTGRYAHKKATIKLSGTGYPDAHATFSISGHGL